MWSHSKIILVHRLQVCRVVQQKIEMELVTLQRKYWCYLIREYFAAQVLNEQETLHQTMNASVKILTVLKFRLKRL